MSYRQEAAFGEEGERGGVGLRDFEINAPAPALSRRFDESLHQPRADAVFPLLRRDGDAQQPRDIFSPRVLNPKHVADELALLARRVGDGQRARQVITKLRGRESMRRVIAD